MEAEAEREDEGKMKEATGSGELLSRVQELEDELKDSEQKRMNEIQALEDKLKDSEQKRMNEIQALENKLKTSKEEEGHLRQENASLKKKLLSELSSRVRRMEGLKHQTSHQ